MNNKEIDLFKEFKKLGYDDIDIKITEAKDEYEMKFYVALMNMFLLIEQDKILIRDGVIK